MVSSFNPNKMEPLLLIYHMSFVFSLKRKGRVKMPIIAHSRWRRWVVTKKEGAWSTPKNHTGYAPTSYTHNTQRVYKSINWSNNFQCYIVTCMSKDHHFRRTTSTGVKPLQFLSLELQLTNLALVVLPSTLTQPINNNLKVGEPPQSRKTRFTHTNSILITNNKYNFVTQLRLQKI